MIVSINPTYYCNFRCPWCYLTPEQLSDKRVLSLEKIREALQEVHTYLDEVTAIDLYGGEITLLDYNYLDSLLSLCTEFTDDINIITNGSNKYHPILRDQRCYVTFSYDGQAREKSAEILDVMREMPRPFSVIVLSSPQAIKQPIEPMINDLKQLPHLQSVEIKPYSKNQANDFEWSFKDHEEYVKKWLSYEKDLDFAIVNSLQIEACIAKTSNSFSDDHIYITPSGNFAVLEFDDRDREYFKEVTLQEYREWCDLEKLRVEQNDICGKCPYLGSCLSEHLREVKDLNNSCNGFRHLLEWYQNGRHYE